LASSISGSSSRNLKFYFQILMGFWLVYWLVCWLYHTFVVTCLPSNIIVHPFIMQFNQDLRNSFVFAPSSLAAMQLLYP
jgi:hypothetical protein